MIERLQKYLSESGIASRRASEELIKAGLVSVNNKIITEMGTKINTDTDLVTYKGELIKKEDSKIYIMLNKPSGYITTVKDQFDRLKVTDLIKDVKYKLHPVGRLDYNSSGLLLLTNDGDITYRLTHPGHEVDKTYWVKVLGIPQENELEKLRNGVLIDNIITSPAVIDIIEIKNNYSKMRFIIHEGKNRQIRKMLSAIGYEVIELKRVSIGELNLGDLKEGEWRYLSKQEIKYINGL